jgi:protein O-GlcNAc transferase
MATSKNNPELIAQAIACFQAGDLRRAEQIVQGLLRDNPENFDLLHLMGVIKSIGGNNGEAEDLYKRALKIHSHHEELRVNLALVLVAGEKPEEALTHIETALSMNAGNAVAQLTRGNILRMLGRRADALAGFDRATSINPRYVKAWVNRGITLSELGRHEEALASCDTALRIDPASAEAWSNRGIACAGLKRSDAALESYDRALAISPDSDATWSNRGNVLGELRRYDEALSSFDRALAIHPGSAEVWSNRGNILGELKRYEEALASFDKALAIDPRHADACYNRGVAFSELKQYDAALASYGQALATGADLPYCLGDWLHTKMMVCDWSGIEDGLDRVVAEIEKGHPVLTPFASLAILATARHQKQCAEIFVRDKYGIAASGAPSPARRESGKLRVGYFSSDFRDHAVSNLTVGMFEEHDRARFEVYGFGLARAGDDPMGRRVIKAFDQFLDLSRLDSAQAVAAARATGIDIAIDLNGHTSGCRTGLFSARIAPVQINYIGHPGTMGASFIDYIIGDRIVIPEQLRADYSEKVVYLPHCFQANDSKRAIAAPATRARYGLDEESFVFCCFNNSYKLTPDYFRVWLGLLRKINGSVLWLLKRCDSQVARLRALAENSGVSGKRLFFADQVNYAEHMGRYVLADLALDTAPFGGGTTTSDVLWAGLPIVTVMGNSFGGRMSASLLNAIGLPELVATTLEHYEILALELATDRGKLLSLRETLSRRRTTSPLFDTRLFTKHLEAAYARMYERYRAGLPPDHMLVDA